MRQSSTNERRHASGDVAFSRQTFSDVASHRARKHPASCRPLVAGVTLMAMLLAAVDASVLAAQSVRPKSLLLEGYTNPMSVKPGEEVGFHVSTNAKQFSIEVARLGAREEIVWTKDGLPGTEYSVEDELGRPAHVAMYGCRWPAAANLVIPDHWRSGFYRVVLRSDDQERGRFRYQEFNPGLITQRPIQFVMFFAVRAAHPGRQAKILLELSSNTYHAYNAWGGASL